jgi:hypothetical protein
MTETGLTPPQLADRWGLSQHTLRGWRLRGIGPPWVTRPRLGTPYGQSRVLYPLPGVLAFEEAQGITPINP